MKCKEIELYLIFHIETTLRQVVGGRVSFIYSIIFYQSTLVDILLQVLQSVISDREGLAHEVAEIVGIFPLVASFRCSFLAQIEATAEKWGVAIESILLKDINFSVELQQSLSSAATQKRIGESKVIAARAEVDAAKLMRQAADVSIQKL